MARGVDLIADAIKPTLGPKGAMGTIRTPYGHQYRTKRGFLIAEGVRPKDFYEVLGADVIKEAAGRTDRLSGDGATTTAILAQFILRDSTRQVAAGVDPFELQHGIEIALKAVARDLKRYTQKARTPHLFAQVGTISADGDIDLGWAVGRTVDVAPSGLITVGGLIGRSDKVDIGSSRGEYKISVRGKSRAAVEERKFRAEAAIRAARAAIEEGVVAGGGTALLHASKALDGLRLTNRHQQAGVEIVRRALQVPIRKLVENAGVNATSVVQTLLRESDFHIGYDVERHNYTDMFGAGIIDPLKTVRTALDGAAHAAAAVIMAPLLKSRRDWAVAQRKNRYIRFFSPEYTARSSKSPGDRPPRSRKPITVQSPRYLVGRFPERIAKGEMATLHVLISQIIREGRAVPIQDLQIPENGITLDIAVQADEFEFLTPDQAPIRVPQAGDSTIAGFDLKAPLREGLFFIRISAFNGGTCVGALELRVQVGAEGTISAASREVEKAILNLVGSEGDVAVWIRLEKKEGRFAFTWFDSEGKQPVAYIEDLLSDPKGILPDVIGQIQEIVRKDRPFPAKVVATKLRSNAIMLWDQLLPSEIGQRFIQRRDKIKRLIIISSEDSVPWEMLYPIAKDGSGDKGFLVEQVEIARWVLGKDLPPSILLNRADFVTPATGELERAELEVGDLALLLQSWNATLQRNRIEEAIQVYELFENKSVSLLHFACHNGFDEDGGRIYINGVPVRARDFKGYYLEKAGGLIFMNACRTDGKSPEYTRIGGWANSFLNTGGVGAFIGTLWEVRDETAQRFSNVFYSELVNDKPFGDALKKARDTVKSEAPGDPTWLAYSFYGNASARVEKG